jgi:hypothetical protein
MSYGRTIRVCQGGVCARCDRQELHNLTTFTKSVDYYWRDMVVAAECLRCAQQRCCLAEGVDRLFKRNEVEVVRVCLPANVVSDARRVRNLSQGALLWGTTAANCELQMAQILNGRRSIEGLTDAESDAVVYLGGPIMRDEEVNGQVRRRCCAGGEVRGTTWTRRAKGEEYGHTGRNADYVPPAPRRGVLRGVRDFGVAAGRMTESCPLKTSEAEPTIRTTTGWVESSSWRWGRRARQEGKRGKQALRRHQPQARHRQWLHRLPRRSPRQS